MTPKDAFIFKESIGGKESIYFDVYGTPFAKQRPRASRIGGFIRVYTPKETKNYEEKVLKAYRKMYGTKQMDGALTVEVEGFFEPSKSIAKKQQELMLQNKIPHTKKPDCDNMAKVCLDALNGVAYHDDAEITNLNISKKFAETAKVRITIIKNE